MTVTDQLAQRMEAARSGMDEALKDLSRLARQADSRHDMAVSEIAREKGEEKSAAPEEVRAGMAAAGNYCRSLIEAHTGEPMPEPSQHDARDQGGKFTPEGSVGHLFRKMIGKP